MVGWARVALVPFLFEDSPKSIGFCSRRMELLVGGGCLIGELRWVGHE